MKVYCFRFVIMDIYLGFMEQVFEIIVWDLRFMVHGYWVKG